MNKEITLVKLIVRYLPLTNAPKCSCIRIELIMRRLRPAFRRAVIVLISPEIKRICGIHPCQVAVSCLNPVFSRRRCASPGIDISRLLIAVGGNISIARVLLLVPPVPVIAKSLSDSWSSVNYFHSGNTCASDSLTVRVLCVGQSVFLRPITFKDR
jgi:hypothetical protein